MSDEAIEQFADKARKAFIKAGGRPGTSVYLGCYSIDYVPEAGIWVYKVEPDGVELLVFASSSNNRHADFSEPGALTDAQEEFLRYLILEALADV